MVLAGRKLPEDGVNSNVMNRRGVFCSAFFQFVFIFMAGTKYFKKETSSSSLCLVNKKGNQSKMCYLEGD